MKITIEGQPYSQKRHRTAKSGHRYDPSSKDKKAIQKALLPIKPTKPLTGLFAVTIRAYFETPKSWSDKKREEHEEWFRPKTPDVDNIEKILFDAMNKYILADDKMIVYTSVSKHYSMNPRTEIEIHEIDNG